MYKIPVSYANPFDESQTIKKDIYFNLNLAEMTRYRAIGGLADKLRKLELVDRDTPEGEEFIYTFFEELIQKSYGERTEDDRFIKKAESQAAFMDSEDYSQCLWHLLFVENATENATNFVNNLFPKDMMEKAAQLEEIERKKADKGERDEPARSPLDDLS